MEDAKTNVEAVPEILVVPFSGQGHLFPSMELCNHLSDRNCKTTLLIPSFLASSIPSSFHRHPLIEIVEIPTPSSHPVAGHHPFHYLHEQMSRGMESYLSIRPTTRPVLCAVVDGLMSSIKDVCSEFNIPTVDFMTSGACSPAINYAAWKARAEDLKPGETRDLPGLPLALSYSDLKGARSSKRTRDLNESSGLSASDGPDGSPDRSNPPTHGRRGGPPGPGEKPRWVDDVEGYLALIINTCDDLERPFINYVRDRIGKPVFGIGPLLPAKYWKSEKSILRDREIRAERRTNLTEEDVIQWLELKQRESVIYVSFGSEVGPTMEEYAELAIALEESSRPFIWAIQPEAGKQGPASHLFGPPQDGGGEKGEGYYPHGLDNKVGERGMIIHGWAPQLLILSHPSTGGFLTHCGWNSTVEAIGRGVPLLTWPIRGDQFYNAKLAVSHLKVGHNISIPDDPPEMVKQGDIAAGIEKLMSDQGVRRRAKELKDTFNRGFPASSSAALNAFLDCLSRN